MVLIYVNICIVHLASVGFRQGTWCYWQALWPDATVVPQEIIHCVFPDIISLVPIHFGLEIPMSFIYIENVIIVLVLYIYIYIIYIYIYIIMQ